MHSYVYLGILLSLIMMLLFSVQWAYGVTCWEIFTGGRIPYPGVDPMTLPRLLENGLKLEKPKNTACSEELWGIGNLCICYLTHCLWVVGFPTLGNKAFQGESGAHNDMRAEGKGRSVQRPCKRLKFENVLTVVPLLFLAHTRIASLTDYNTRMVGKDHCKT